MQEVCIFDEEAEGEAIKKRKFTSYDFLASIAMANHFSSETSSVQDGIAAFISLMYLLLAIVLAVYGWKLLYLVGVKNIRVKTKKDGSGREVSGWRGNATTLKKIVLRTLAFN